MIARVNRDDLAGSRSLLHSCDAPSQRVTTCCREIHSGPRREPGRLPACYFVGERNSVVRIRTQVRMRLEVTEHLCYLGGPRKELSENFLWDLLEGKVMSQSI